LTCNVEPALRVRPPVLSLPGFVAPGAKVPPPFTITASSIIPPPPSWPGLLTTTVPDPVPEPIVLVTSRVPPVTVVPPEYELLPDKVSVPVPCLIRPPDPRTVTLAPLPAVSRPPDDTLTP